jgi:hypothetical protein
VQHLTVRVAWHDRAWDGTVCDHPSENGFCLALKHEGSAGNRRAVFEGLPRVPPLVVIVFFFVVVGVAVVRAGWVPREDVGRGLLSWMAIVHGLRVQKSLEATNFAIVVVNTHIT